jgi:tetratricopeptide (TPR) repeat protein
LRYLKRYEEAREDYQKAIELDDTFADAYIGLTLVYNALSDYPAALQTISKVVELNTLVGEQRYVFGPDNLRPIAFPRHALHAYRLVFQHPADGRTLQLEAPVPEDFTELLERLRRSAGNAHNPRRRTSS